MSVIFIQSRRASCVVVWVELWSIDYSLPVGRGKFVGKESHAKTQSRQEDRKGVEGFFILRAFFASLRLGVRPPFSPPLPKLNHYGK
jgi:hypothetical protein